MEVSRHYLYLYSAMLTQQLNQTSILATCFYASHLISTSFRLTSCTKITVRPRQNQLFVLMASPLESSVPSSVVPPTRLGKSSEDFSPAESKVFLGDFGDAWRPSTQSRYESHAPLSFMPPEAKFEPERGLSFPADIWTLACSIWIILGQRLLF